MNLLARTHGCEWGWLVATFIPYLRRISHKYDKIVIVCNEGEEYLCEFATSFEYMDKKGRSSGWLFKDKAIGMPSKFKRMYPGYKIVTPTKKNCTTKKREYVKYGTFYEYLRYDIVLHSRSEAKYGRGNRNWPVARYSKLLKKLRLDRELSVCSIGTFAGSYHIPGTLDMRGADLEYLCNVMASSRVCVGCSSGPMHLAQLCGCRVVVWTDNEYQKWVGGTNKDRYKRLWNPHKTKAKVIEDYGWQPPADVVAKAVNKMLRKV
ncbi:MAG: glycosyltransferase family 9 protein [bacterium]|nr:glycosyltransferase family 9 protein [bacterium]